MIQHYFKIAFRNILKYKTQNIISIFGLALGFTCFALATLWIHYEMTYDDFHEGADRIYFVGRKNLVEDKNTVFASSRLPYAVHKQLKLVFPEIESSCVWNHDRIQIDSTQTSYTSLARIDSSFIKMFNVKIQEGSSVDFLYFPDKVAIAEKAAIKLYGHTSVIGKKVNEQQTICAVVSGFGKHTNLPYDFLGNLIQMTDPTMENYTTLIRLRKGTNVDVFQRKLAKAKIEIKNNQNRTDISKNLGIVPITEYHYRPQNIAIQIHYLKLFAAIGGLVIFCSLINYLFLFASRLHIRAREINLRKVCGSSMSHLYLMLTIDFLLILLFSGLLGMFFIELSSESFKKYSLVEGNIYTEASLYFVIMSILALCLVSPIILKHKNTIKGNQHLFRKFALILQISIGMLFFFSITVLIKQTHFLRNTDIGIKRKGIATMTCWNTSEGELAQVNHEIKKMPFVNETLLNVCSLIPYKENVTGIFSSWDDKKEDDAPVAFSIMYHTLGLVRFYGIKLKEGEMLNEDDTDRILINETAVKKLGVQHPLGMKIGMYTVIGVVKDFHNTAPTVPIPPMMFLQNVHSGDARGPWCCETDIIVKYEVGQWKELKQNVDSIMELQLPGRHYILRDAEKEYEKEIQSENSLIKVLGVMSTVCILISAFGIFSFVTLSCEQRRKEIAVRKVNGATMKNILYMFAKEYSILLVVASIFSFPLGYVLMKRWLEDYVEQTNISAWIYCVIFIGTAFIITLCIGWRVWLTARQNPAEVIKSDRTI
ncbi:ABC transporter permease [Bacteroides sp. AM16-24]|uniref:ABC transporter permease n=1 Tax=Bacteroides sp. AM16-24 TaxID=2292002 RepID=UPI000E48939E|nr:ABC transporter permease [Bacteroides sp. AM16-24]DAK76518.1 MAG TPA: permease [Caudoviricetes sp.]